MSGQRERLTTTRGQLLARLILLLAIVASVTFGGGRLIALGKHMGRSAGLGVSLVTTGGVTTLARIAWQPDDADTGRAMESPTRLEIATDYARAWRQLNLSYRQGGPAGLGTYFAGPALAAAEGATGTAGLPGWQITQADTAHALQLHFYSADGSIVGFTDAGAAVARIVRDETGATVLTGETIETYDVVMFLDDGNWRIRQFLRTASTPSGEVALAVPATGLVGRSGTGLTLDGQPFHVAGINYYPQGQPWHTFWPGYNGATIEHDFGVIGALGLNTVRVFVPFAGFGGATPDPIMLGRLDDLLARAQAHQLKVIVTLFDFRADYDPLAWADSDRQLVGLIPRYAGHPAILAWDLKNEPDLDYQQGQDTVDLWLAHTLRFVRQLDPHHLVTIGWSNPEDARGLATGIDLVSFHYYTAPEAFAGAYRSLRAAVPDRPIALTEFGLSTWNSPFFPGGHTETEQAATIATLRQALAQTDSAGYLAWTLYDFGRVPGDVAGKEPWLTGPQGQFGVLRADGTPKPAAFALNPQTVPIAPLPSLWERALKPFYILLFACFVSAAILIVVGLRSMAQRVTRMRSSQSTADLSDNERDE